MAYVHPKPTIPARTAVLDMGKAVLDIFETDAQYFDATELTMV